jgi:hypothetical protein
MGNSSNEILSLGSNLLLWDIQGYGETESLFSFQLQIRVKYDKHRE